MLPFLPFPFPIFSLSTSFLTYPAFSFSLSLLNSCSSLSLLGVESRVLGTLGMYTTELHPILFHLFLLPPFSSFFPVTKITGHILRVEKELGVESGVSLRSSLLTVVIAVYIFWPPLLCLRKEDSG